MTKVGSQPCAGSEPRPPTAKESPSEASMSPVHIALRPQESDAGRGRDSALEPGEFHLQEPALTDMVTTMCLQQSLAWHQRLAEAPAPAGSPLVARSGATP